MTIAGPIKVRTVDLHKMLRDEAGIDVCTDAVNSGDHPEGPQPVGERLLDQCRRSDGT